MIKISVIIPVYNVEKYLYDCLYSVVNQTHKNLEIIIVNDGSTDNSQQIIDEFARKDNRIKAFVKKNRGLSSARNYGLTQATGDYIAFVDSDDFIELDMYESMITSADDIDIYMCGHYLYDNIELINGTYHYDVRSFTKTEAVRELCKNTVIESHAWDKLFKKELFDKIKFPEGRNYEDIFIMHKLFLKANTFLHINSPKYYYRQREGSIIKTKSEKNYHDFFDALIDRYNTFLQLNDIESAKYVLSYLVSSYIHASQYVKNKVLKYVKKFIIKQNLDFFTSLSKTKQIQWTINKKFKIPFKAQYKIFKILKKLPHKSSFFNHKDSLNISNYNKKIFYIGYPEYNNLGDHAIGYASTKYLKNNFKDYDIVILTEKQYFSNLKQLKKCIIESDILYLQGGGNMGDEYHDQDVLRLSVLKHFKKNTIINFPVTIFFKDIKNEKKLLHRYAKPNYHIVCREKYSYNIKNTYTNLNLYLTPDIVLYLSNKINFNATRTNDVIICLRNDVESNLSFNDRLKIKNYIIKQNHLIKTLDTCTKYSIPCINSEDELMLLLEEFSKAKLVVTDRLHGLIFSYITKTPCLVLTNYNHKIIGIYDWINKNKKYLLTTMENFNDNFIKIMSAQNDQYDTFDNCFEILKSLSTLL